MSPDGCPGYPDTGVYYISTNGSYVGEQKVGTVDNIVVNNKKTAFYFRWLHANPCTYEINLGSNGNSQWIRNDQQWVNIFNGQYGQWALRKSGTAYIIGPKNSNLVWTDMGPGSPANRQIQLRPFQSGNNRQQFRISNN